MTVDEYDERWNWHRRLHGIGIGSSAPGSRGTKGTKIPGHTSPLEAETLQLFGNKNRQGTGTARSLRVKSIFGNVRIDMGRTPGDEADVICSPFFGTIVIRVPPDTIVEVRAGAFLGDVDNRIQETGAPKVRRLIVRGRALFGSLRIETVYPKGIGRK